MSAPDLARLAGAAEAEVARQMTICNACRYCEGLCAVFPAMERRRDFAPGDAALLANLCHDCGACHYDCQYAPPHEFAVNVPAAMAALREEGYARHAWPAAARPLLSGANGLVVALALVAGVAVFVLGFVLAADPAALFAAGAEPGAFYRVMPHNAMVAVFGAAFGFALLAIWRGLADFWRATGPPGGVTWAMLSEAAGSAARLRNLEGGGAGCMNAGERPERLRRRAHHLVFYGFLLCLAATASGTVAHYLLDAPAPYPWWSPVKLFGVTGGLGLSLGAAGLLAARARRDGALRSAPDGGMGAAFLWTLLLLGVTGLALTALRASPAMGLLLAVHLGVVFAFFVTMPYGKFVHGLYRFAALLRDAREKAEGRG